MWKKDGVRVNKYYIYKIKGEEVFHLVAEGDKDELSILEITEGMELMGEFLTHETKPNKYLWFCSHIHSDENTPLIKILSKKNRNIDFER